MKLPRTFGKIVNDLVYDRLAPGVRQELNRKNPVVTKKGRRRHKHFQWLTEGIGNPKLLHHLGLLEGMARGFDDEDWDGFYDRVNRVLPRTSRCRCSTSKTRRGMKRWERIAR